MAARYLSLYCDTYQAESASDGRYPGQISLMTGIAFTASTEVVASASSISSKPEK
jgi:hypothetical protein